MNAFLPSVEYLALPRAPQSWLIDPILPAGGSMMIYGDAKLGKTYAALQLAHSVATGVPWFGYPVRKTGRVCYLQLDTPPNLWAAVPDAYLGILQKEGMIPHPNLFWGDRETLGACWPFNALDPEHILLLKDWVSELQPDLVVLDTFREIHRGDENKSNDMQSVIGNLVAATTPAAMLLVHHSKKPSQDQGPDVRNDMRGGYIAGRMDTVFQLTKHQARYFGRAVEDGHVKVERLENLLWREVVDPIMEEIARIVAETPPGASQRELARAIAATTGRSEDACRQLLRRAALK